jgi:hypothetical protein
LEIVRAVRSIGIISAGFEVIDAFGGFEDFGAGVERVHQACDGRSAIFRRKAFSLELAFSMGFISGL